ncbi:MAG: efflux RND transporter periplasmic adaptor subunit [Deltaproteobacteria bacterium]|nr:MAG: efflux RND transporter periplasmic adaptor subunit [Deltaproteobacteria bacterium]
MGESSADRGGRRWWWRIVVGVVLLGALVWLTRGFWLPAEVELVEVEERDVVETLLTTGRLTVRGTRGLGPEVAGRVERVLVEEGDRVESGAVLVELNASDARLGLESAGAALAEAEARLEGLRRTVRPVAVVALEQSRLDVERTARELSRAEGLLERGAGTAQAVDAARDAFRAAELAQSRAEAEVRALGSRGAEVLAALAQVERLGVEVERASQRVGRHAVTSPLAGLIAMRDVEEGEVVSAGQRLLMLAPLEGLEIRVQPDERELARLEVGQRAWVGSEVLGTEPLPARVDRILPAVDPQRGTLDARLVLEGVSAGVRPNLTVDVEVELGVQPSQAVVPASALREEGGAAWVLVVVEGRLERRDVEIGWRGESDVALQSGISSGERIVREASGLEAGQRVRVREAEAGAREAGGALSGSAGAGVTGPGSAGDGGAGAGSADEGAQ